MYRAGKEALNGDIDITNRADSNWTIEDQICFCDLETGSLRTVDKFKAGSKLKMLFLQFIRSCRVLHVSTKPSTVMNRSFLATVPVSTAAC